MLDAYIIDRIRRENERQRKEGGFVPLQIEAPRPPQRPERKERKEDESDRGSVIIDFSS